MALLVSSVFGVAGCGSDDDVQVESRVKNVAPEASGVSDGPSEADCDLLDRDLRDLLDLHVLRNDLEPDDPDDIDDLNDSELRDLLDRRDLFNLRDLRYLLDLLDQCDAASDSGAGAPKGDDVDGG